MINRYGTKQIGQLIPDYFDSFCRIAVLIPEMFHLMNEQYIVFPVLNATIIKHHYRRKLRNMLNVIYDLQLMVKYFMHIKSCIFLHWTYQLYVHQELAV